MANDYRTYNKSRLEKIEDKKNKRQALFFTLLTITALILLIVFGVPALIKLAIFLGDIRSSSKSVEIDQNIAVLPAPTLLSTYEATNSATIKVSGYGPANTQINLLVNGHTLTVDSDTEGSFSFKKVDLTSGENRLEAYAVLNGQESKKSNTVKITYDSSPPELIIDSPQEGNKFYDFDKDVEIRGLTEPESTLYINDRFIILKTDGSFNTAERLSDGDNLIIVRAIDNAGNQTIKQLTVTYYP